MCTIKPMDIDEIQKAVAAFESKLKPVSAIEKAMAAGQDIEITLAPPKKTSAFPIQPMETPPAPVPAPAGASCVSKPFKKVVVALYPEYLGQGDTVDLIKDFIDSLPECEA